MYQATSVAPIMYQAWKISAISSGVVSSRRPRTFLVPLEASNVWIMGKYWPCSIAMLVYQRVVIGRTITTIFSACSREISRESIYREDVLFFWGGSGSANPQLKWLRVYKRSWRYSWKLQFYSKALRCLAFFDILVRYQQTEHHDPHILSKPKPHVNQS